MKMTNRDASRFLSPVVDKMFNDGGRQFTITDAHLLMRAIETIKTKMITYQKQAQDIMKKHGAEQDGQAMKFKTSEDAASATQALQELNQIEVQFDLEKVKARKSWPNLSLAEMYCLKPILDMSEIEGGT